MQIYSPFRSVKTVEGTNDGRLTKKNYIPYKHSIQRLVETETYSVTGNGRIVEQFCLTNDSVDGLLITERDLAVLRPATTANRQQSRGTVTTGSIPEYYSNIIIQTDTVECLYFLTSKGKQGETLDFQVKPGKIYQFLRETGAGFEIRDTKFQALSGRGG